MGTVGQHLAAAVAPAIASVSSLDQYAAPLRAVLEDEAITDLCIQHPGVGFVARRGRWERIELPFASLTWCTGFVRLLAASTQQVVDGERPLLSASLPGGERIQVVLPPAAEAGTVVITVRRASRRRWTLEELVGAPAGEAGTPPGAPAARERTGVSAHDEEGLGEGSDAGRPRVTVVVRNGGSGGWLAQQDGARVQRELFGPAAAPRGAGVKEAVGAADVAAVLRAAVRARKNILVSGPTGSGKTTLTNALIGEIPEGERLVVIEDAAELSLERHPNAVRLLYSKDGQGLSKGLTAKRLLEASLRLRPDRILLAELRGEEAYDYLRAVNSGHPGSITSIHASSAELALRQLGLLVRESVAGRALSVGEIEALTSALVDVVVQCGAAAVD